MSEKDYYFFIDNLGNKWYLHITKTNRYYFSKTLNADKALKELPVGYDIVCTPTIRWTPENPVYRCPVLKRSLE